jgi:3-hydroxyisobutyrate dehydrogenase
MNQVVLAEGLAMAREAGIPDDVFADTVGDSSGGSYALDRDMQGFILPDDYDSEFTLSLMRKDAGIAERFATANDIPILLGGVSGLYRVGEAMGYGDLDSSAIAKLYEDLQTNG